MGSLYNNELRKLHKYGVSIYTAGIDYLNTRIFYNNSNRVVSSTIVVLLPFLMTAYEMVGSATRMLGRAFILVLEKGR